MQVSSEKNRALLREKKEMGVVGSAMRSLIEKTAFASASPCRSDKFEFLESIKKGWAHPSLIVREFYKSVPLSKRVRIYETIGNYRALSLYDRIMNRFWRSQKSVNDQIRLHGKEVALKDPYLFIAPFVESVFTK